MIKLVTIQKYLDYLIDLREHTIKNCNHVEIDLICAKHHVSNSIFFHVKKLNYFTRTENGKVTCNILKFEPIHARKLIEHIHEYSELQKSKCRKSDTRELRTLNNKAEQNKIPPSLDEVKEYCKSRNNNVNPDRWHSYYQSNGWKVGKNKMVNWQACIRTWEKDKSIIDTKNKQQNELVINKPAINQYKMITEYTYDELKDKLQRIMNELNRRGYSGSIIMTETIKF